ncbi:MAG: peptidoglycan editing factor PgeF [Ktedonobacterales bacterium]|nr:peptidoglycan editing factor PgeF [Ktedonobacterales bacterium]
MIERRVEHAEYLAFSHLSAARGLAHAIFTRRGGFSLPPYRGLNLAISTGDDPARVRRNRAVAAEALGLALVSARAVHSAHLLVITRADRANAEAEAEANANDARPWQERLRERLRLLPADALITDQPGIALFWAFGDCAPVLLYDPRHRVVALVHAGWRGTAQAVVPRTIARMSEDFGTRPADLLAGIGPAIGACCYEVSEEVRAAFAADGLTSASAHFEERPGARGQGRRLFLDIARSNEGQLLAAGVARERVALSGYCTGCRTDLFYSHRREPKPSGRFGVGIGLREA